jgi:hypothetical protein
VRDVLNPSQQIVATQSFGDSLTDLHFTANGTTLLTFTVSAQKKSGVARLITDTISQTVYFLN